MNNILTIDLSNYSTTILNTSIYQKCFTASSPLSLNATTKILSVDLTAYQKSLSVSTTPALPLSLNSTTNALTIDLSAYQKTLSVINTTASPLTLNSNTVL